MEITTIPLGRIVTHEKNLRHDVGDVTELAASIAEQGLLEPILVAPVPDELSDEPCYVLIAGHRRVAAAVKAPGVDELPGIVRDDLDTNSKIIEAMLVENLQRKDLTPIEEAAGYEQLTLDGYDVDRISRATGRSASTVRSRLSLTKLPETVQQRVHTGQLTLAHAEAMAEFADDPEFLAKLAENSDPGWEIKAEQNRRKQVAATEKSLAEAEARGVRVIRDWSEVDDQVRERMREVWQIVQGPWDERRQQEKDHETECEHHALSPRRYGGVDAWCLQPDVHPQYREMQAASSSTPVGYDPEREAQAEREAEFQHACETAQEIRHEWLRDRIRSSKLTAVDVCYIMAATAREGTRYVLEAVPSHVAVWLGLKVDGYGDDLDAEGAVTEWLDTASMTPTAVKSPAKALLAILAATNEPIHHFRWQHYSDEIRGWIGLLEQLGYKPTEWEREQLDAMEASEADDESEGEVASDADA